MPGENEPKFSNLNEDINQLNISKKEILELEKEVIEPKVRKIVKESMFMNPFPNFWQLPAKLDKNKAEDDIVNYIIEWNLNSWKDLELEEYIKNLSYNPLVRKLKKLVDNPNLEAALKEIEEKDKEITDKNKKNLEESYKLANKQENPTTSFFDKFKEKVKWIWSHLVDLSKVPEKVWLLFCDILAKGEEYIWQKYVRGKMDCSMFLSILLCIWQWIEPKRLGTSRSFSQSYPEVQQEDIRCWDIMYNEWHVEMVVWVPYEKNGRIYVSTFWSSTDKYENDPMFDKFWNPIKNKNWVWYRERKIYPEPRHSYTYFRPPYDQWIKKKN